MACGNLAVVLAGLSPRFSRPAIRKFPELPMNLLAKNNGWRLNSSRPVNLTMSQINAAPSSAKGGSPYLIFVVDDSAMLVEFAAMVLQSAGYAVK
jgi:hypothetical protein